MPLDSWYNIPIAKQSAMNIRRIMWCAQYSTVIYSISTLLWSAPTDIQNTPNRKMSSCLNRTLPQAEVFKAFMKWRSTFSHSNLSEETGQLRLECSRKDLRPLFFWGSGCRMKQIKRLQVLDTVWGIAKYHMYMIIYHHIGCIGSDLEWHSFHFVSTGCRMTRVDAGDLPLDPATAIGEIVSLPQGRVEWSFWDGKYPASVPDRELQPLANTTRWLPPLNTPPYRKPWSKRAALMVNMLAYRE